MAFAEPQFRLSEERLDDVTQVIAVGGEIHVSTAPEFSRDLAAALGDGAGRVVLDLSAVEFIDSTGLSVLLNALRQVTRSGGRMALVCSNPTVLRLFVITRLDATFRIVGSREAALADVRGADGAADNAARQDLAGGSTDGAP